MHSSCLTPYRYHTLCFSLISPPLQVSQSDRLKKSLYALLFLTVLTPLFLSTLFPTLSPVPFFVLLILLTLSFSLLTSFLQSSSIAIAALHGSKEMLCVMSGQGGVAVLIASVQLYLGIVSVWGGDEGNPTPPDEHLHTSVVAVGEASGVSNAQLSSGVGLWAISTVPILMCIMVGKRLLHLEPSSATSGSQSRYSSQVGKARAEMHNEVDETLDFEHPGRDTIHASTHPSRNEGQPTRSGPNAYNDETPLTENDEEVSERQLRFVAEEDEEEHLRHTAAAKGWRGMKGMMWKNRVVYFSVAWVFVVTLVSSNLVYV
jgi:hypothetical protein